MKKLFFLLIIIIFVIGATYKFRRYIPFLKSRLGATTVSKAIKEIEPRVLDSFQALEAWPLDHAKKVKILILKKERLLRIYSQGEDEGLKIFKEYPFTAFSGQLGPKNQSGDEQIPEGFYKIIGLNPNSSYHLSLKLNYPNQTDLKRAQINNINNPGGDIFIHGKSFTIGCIPIGDKAIEELFYLVHEVGKQNVDVIIVPSLKSSEWNEGRFSLSPRDKAWITMKYSKLKFQMQTLGFSL